MRTTKLLATILVAGLIVSACQQDPDYVLPAIRVASSELYFSVDTEQPLELTATRDWRVRSKPEWVTVSPDQGSGAESLQRVRIAVDANPNYNRTGEVIFSIGLAKAAVAIIQPGSKGEVPVGSGTLEDPYTVTGVLRYIATLGADVESPQTVYVKGKISSVDDPYGAQYGSGTFKIKDADGDATFQVYRAYFLGNKKWTASDPQIKVDDEVIVCGTVVNFKGNTPETAQNKAYIYSLNGNTASGGGGGGQTAEVKTVTVAEFNAAEPSATQKYQLTGKVTGTLNSTYGNFDLEDATGTVYVYGLTKTDLGYGSKNDQSFASLGIKAGDTVTLIGYRATFTKDGQSKIEVVNAYYVSHTSGGGGNGSGNQGGSTIFSQAFKTDGQGSFTIEDKTTLPEGATYVWSYDNRYGMKASAYANNANFAAESWLVSPAIDLTAVTKPVLTFRHALNFFSSLDKAKEEATVWAKPEGGEWAKLSGVIYPESLSWTFVDSGEIDLSAYAGKKIQIGFKYVSTATKAGTWEIDNFEVKNK